MKKKMPSDRKNADSGTLGIEGDERGQSSPRGKALIARQTKKPRRNTMSTPNNRTNTQAHDGQIIVGIKKNLQNVSNLPLGGQTFTSASLIAFFQSRIDAANAVSAAKAQWLDAGKKYMAVDTTTDLVARGLKQYVMNAFGTTSPVLADFGFAAPKRAPQTVEQKTEAIAKRAATRKARNTMGKKAKLAIKGTVPSTAPATPVAPTTPAVPTTPAPPAPVNTSPPPVHAPVAAAHEAPSGKS
jgi:hypothetical protein